MQALGELTPGQRAERRIELPEDIGQGKGEIELDKRVVQVALERCVEVVRSPGELVGKGDRFA